MFIRSQRLFLRPVWVEDWAEILAGVNEAAVVRNLTAVPWPYTAEDARHFANRPQDQRFPHFLVTRPVSGVDAQVVGQGSAEVIGCIGLAAGEGADGRGVAELGFWIARRHWGKGYATEAARALLTLAPVLGHHRLTATCFRDNSASSRVLRKLGFSPTGQVSPRISAARGEPAPAANFAIELESSDAGVREALRAA